jgi:hypothetical protein
VTSAVTRRVQWFIGVFLAVQLLAPLHYYLIREDTNDERFAWRMFSPTRMLSCEPSFTRGDESKPIDLMKEFHEAWITVARRGRIEVIERMGAALCERNPGQPIKVELSCRTVEGKYEKRGGWNICAVGEL